MRNLFAGLQVAAGLTVLVICMTGCESKVEVSPEQAILNSEIENSPWDKAIKYEYDGHKYIKFRGFKQGAAVHDPDCPCRLR